MAEIEAGYGRLYDAAACDAVVRVFRDKAFTLSEWQANAGRTESRPSRLAPTNPSQSRKNARIWVAEWLQTGSRGVSRRAREARFPSKLMVDRRRVEPLTSAVQRPSS